MSKDKSLTDLELVPFGSSASTTQDSSNLIDKELTPFGEEVGVPVINKVSTLKSKPNDIPSVIGDTGMVTNDIEDFIKSYEGFIPIAKDIGDGKVTGGYGTTGKFKVGDKVSEEVGRVELTNDINKARKDVNRLVKIRLSKGEEDALVSLVYNVGPSAFAKSSALKALNKGDKKTFMDEAFSAEKGWVMKGSKFQAGLTKRRKAEQDRFVMSGGWEEGVDLTPFGSGNAQAASVEGDGEEIVEEPEVKSKPGKLSDITDDFYKRMYGAKNESDYVADQDDPKFIEQAGQAFSDTFKTLRVLKGRPDMVFKGIADFALAAPGFMVAMLDGATNATHEIVNQISNTKKDKANFYGEEVDAYVIPINLMDAYNYAAEGFQKSMGYFEGGKTPIIGEVPEESKLIGEIAMAPLTALSMVGQEVASADMFKEYPNVRGAALFAGDVAGIAAMGIIMHGKGAKAKVAKDIETVVEAAKDIKVKSEKLQEIPNEIYKQAAAKILEVEKVQLELKAKDIAESISKDAVIREELLVQAERIAQEKMRPVQGRPEQTVVNLKGDKYNKVDGEWVDVDGNKVTNHMKLKSIEKSVERQVNEPITNRQAEEAMGIVKSKETKAREAFVESDPVVPDRIEIKRTESVVEDIELSPAEKVEIAKEEAKFSADQTVKIKKELVKLRNDKESASGEKLQELEVKHDELLDQLDAHKPKVEVIRRKKKVEPEPVPEPITEVDQATGRELPNSEGTASVFYQKPEKSAVMADIFNEKGAAVGDSIEMFTQKIINDVNQWFNRQGEIDIDGARNGLSELAARADELRWEFITGRDHAVWVETVREAAAWARKLDRFEIERSVDGSKVKPKELTREQKIEKLMGTLNGQKGIKLTSGVDPTQGIKAIVDGAKGVAEYMKKARGLKSFRPKVALKRLKEEVVRSGIDKSGNIRSSLMNELGAKGYEVVQKMVLSKGASSISANMLKQMNKEVYSGLSGKEKNVLDTLILANRIGDIAKYKSEGKFAYPKGLEPTSVAAYSELFGEIEGLSSKRAGEIKRRAEAYFEWMKKPLKDMLDSELINQAEYDALISHDYQKLKLVEIFDKKRQGLGKKGRSVYDSGVEALSKGRDTDIFEPSSEIMALEVFNRAYGRIMNNEANKSLLDVAKSDPLNEFVRVKGDKGDKIPSGWQKSYVYEKGEKKTLWLSPEMTKEWITSNPDVTYKHAQMLRYASGSPVLRTMATGINWGFALANLPKDVMHNWFASRTWKDGEWSSAYSPTAPKFAMQVGADLGRTFSDALLRKGRYEDYIKEGGGMEFLVHQGRLFQRGRHLGGPIDAMMDFMGYFGETTEIMTRLAIRDRVIRRRAKEQGLSIEQAREVKDITREATFAARDYMDFGQGGTTVKAMDNAIPYLSATVQGTRGMFRSFIPGSGTALGSTYKLAQFAAMTSGLAIASWAMHPKTMENMQGNIDAENNIIIPMGDRFGFEDDRGQVRYPYFKIPLDPGQKYFKAFFEASTAKWLGKDVDEIKVSESLLSLSPVGMSSLPPTISGTLGYMANKDFWMNEDIWRKTDKPFSYPNSKEEYTPGRTPQAYIDMGEATGLSPERTKYAVEELVTGGTVWSYMLGKGYEAMFSDQPEDNSKQHMAQTLARVPIAKRFIGVTNPYSKHAEKIDKADESATLNRFKENRGFDALAEGYLFKDNVKYSEVIDYIYDTKDRKSISRLKERFKFQQATRELPERSFWLRLQDVAVEARAEVFVDRLKKASPEQQEQLWKEYAIIGRAGGVISKEFRSEVSKVMGEE